MTEAERPPGSTPAGIVVVDKPPGLTSHQVVGRLRRLLGTRRVGHAGTLDPMATGVLVVGVNRATRLLGYLTLTDKAYVATIRLGAGTVTDDADGQVTATAGARDVADDSVEAALVRLRGEISQVPSAVSAVKVGGVRSYARVRAGEAVQLAARTVRVDRFAVVARRDADEFVDLDVEVECSSGTYVRALARDLGAALGTGAHLTALRRTRVGPFTLADAQSLDAVPDVLDLGAVAHRCFATVALGRAEEQAVRYGRRLPDLDLPANPTALLAPDGTFLALYRPGAEGAVPEAVFVG